MIALLLAAALSPLGLFMQDVREACRELRIKPCPTIALVQRITNSATGELGDSGLIWRGGEYYLMIRRECVFSECDGDRLRLIARHEVCHLKLHPQYARDPSLVSVGVSLRIEEEARLCAERKGKRNAEPR